ncbi:MAG: hypothetical protein AAFR89_10885 [Cyanobacteria bacterium J06633_1]
MPTVRNARGVDAIAYSCDATRFISVQIKALSKKAPVPLGKSLDKIMGDFWVVVNNVATDPTPYILTPDEVRSMAHRGEKEGRISYWLQPRSYVRENFFSAWSRIGRGDI